MWATGEVYEKLRRDLECDTDENIWELLHVDRPLAIGPVCRLNHHPDDPQADIWGIRHQTIDYETGAYSELAHSPLANVTTVQEIEAYRWPNPGDFDYAPVTEAAAAQDGTRVIHSCGHEPFLLYCALRGLEQGLEDMILNPDICDAALAHINDFMYERNRRTFEAADGVVDTTYIAEDLGSQTGPLFSLAHYRRFLLPAQVRMADLAREYGIHIMYHTDGSAVDFLPDLIGKVGIEILNPIQWRCPGMEREKLVREFGNDVIFHGAMDNQQTMPFGTVDDVIAEVKENIEIFSGCRWICAPCHNLQAVSPTENIVSMYETIHELGAL